MKLLDTIRSLYDAPVDKFNRDTTAMQVEQLLDRERLCFDDLPILLSSAAGNCIERMTQQAAAVTRRYFGNSILLFTPLYIANFCDNRCPYCSFGRHQQIRRTKLTIAQISLEAQAISATGMRHVLVLTGESQRFSSLDYLAEAVTELRKHFAGIAIEIYPLSVDGYARLVAAGVDGLTIYQECYDAVRYHVLHNGGPKDDYQFRLDAPDRAIRAGVRRVTIGPLLGLADPWREVMAAAYHLRYLLETWPDIELAVAFPRLRPLVSDFTPEATVSDQQLVQFITAFRLIFPTVGITLSTRESAEFRTNAVNLGVTKISAGVSTAVGGRLDPHAPPQFEIADTRSAAQVCSDLSAAGLQPVMRDRIQE
jgi:2-iminoacetate synthase